MDLSSILTGGAAGRSDSLSGLDPEFMQIIEALYAAAPPEVQKGLQITSGFRSPEVQAQLYKNAVRKYGSESAARKWVAPPGRSHHGMGDAIDWKFGSDAARDWVHENASRFGGSFPLGHEPWHMEIAGSRGGGGGVAPTTGLTLNTSSPPAAAPSSGFIPSPPAASPAAPSAPGTGNPLSLIAKAIGGATGGQEQQQSEASQITPSSIGMETNTVLPSMAANMMAMLMQDRRSRYGVI